MKTSCHKAKNVNPLTPRDLCKKHIFWTFWRFSGWSMGQISSNLLQKAFATWQHAFLSTGNVFYDIFAQASTGVKILRFWTREWPTSLCFCFVFFYFFLCLFFFSLSYLAAVIGLLLGSLPVQTLARKHDQEGQFLPWSNHVYHLPGNFAPSISLKFLSISVHISGSIDPIILILVSLKRSSPGCKLDYRWCQLGQRWWHQKWNKGHGSQWVNEMPITQLYNKHTIFDCFLFIYFPQLSYIISQRVIWVRRA